MVIAPFGLLRTNAPSFLSIRAAHLLMELKILFLAIAVSALFLSGCAQQQGNEVLPPEITQMKALCQSTGGSFTYCAPGLQCLVGTGCHCPDGKQFDETLGCMYSQDANEKRLCEKSGGRYNYCGQQACISGCICNPGEKSDSQRGCVAQNGSETPPPPPDDNSSGPQVKCQDWVTLASSPSQSGAIVSQFEGIFHANALPEGANTLMRTLPYRIENLSLGISESPTAQLTYFSGKNVLITGELETIPYEKIYPVSGLSPYRLKIYEIADANLNLPVPATRLNQIPAGANVQTFRGMLVSHIPPTPPEGMQMMPPAPTYAFYSLDFPAQIHTGSDPLLSSLDGAQVVAVGVYSHYQLEGQWLDEIELLKVQNNCPATAGASRTREQQALFDLCISTGGNMDSCPIGTYCKVEESCRCPSGDFTMANGCISANAPAQGNYSIPESLQSCKRICEGSGGSFTYCAPGLECFVGTGCLCPNRGYLNCDALESANGCAIATD
jgi:hypothetical protein